MIRVTAITTRGVLDVLGKNQQILLQAEWLILARDKFKLGLEEIQFGGFIPWEEESLKMDVLITMPDTMISTVSIWKEVGLAFLEQLESTEFLPKNMPVYVNIQIEPGTMGKRPTFTRSGYRD